ncbi:MAG: 4-hydroxy-3-methylbut-2-enyl diphosphate reductase [Polaromonas sp.]|nr:4-hydroxy-3-methylbut-2-enyl diphosphate reductase [Polaromonas sp.]
MTAPTLPTSRSSLPLQGATPPESAHLQAVQARAGGLGAAAFSPEGAAAPAVWQSQSRGPDLKEIVSMPDASLDAPPVQLEEILLAEPRGFCAGVDRAIEIVERALAKFGAPIYVRHEIVHNTYVVNDLKTKGAIFIEELSDVPPGATLVFSAHGVSRAVQEEARARGFQIFDATCPLVTKVHVEVAKLSKEGYEFIMIGHKGHPEVEGTMGQLDSGIHLVEDVADVARILPLQTERLAVVTQTTLSVDDAAEISAAIVARFPQVRKPKHQDICYATQNRQDAVKVLSPQVDILIVVGSPTSSNSNRLRELAAKLGTEAYMVDDASELQEAWFNGKSRVGLTAGASAPEILVMQVIDRIKALGAVSIRKMKGVEETLKFPLPKGLKLDAQGHQLELGGSQLHQLN